jgi:uncharacterized hydrophobic protein (TIGR00271 family)
MSTLDHALEQRATVRAVIASNSRFDVPYVTMNALATIVATYGLLENSPAVVIGAMIIAMLLGPISGISLGLMDQNNRLLVKALATLAGGVFVVYATAFILGVVHSRFPLTGEMYARTAPNLMDLMIALAAGAAGAYSMLSPRLNTALVGAAISTALVPPLATSALCLARGENQLSYGAFLLALTNIVGIQAAGSGVMWLSGYRGDRIPIPGRVQMKRSLLSAVLLSALAVLLGFNLRTLIRNEVFEVTVRRALETDASSHQGAHLAEVRFQRTPAVTVIVAVYRTPTPFTPQEVAAFEASLPPSEGEHAQELRIRSIPVTVASKDGYLYSSADLAEFAAFPPR